MFIRSILGEGLIPKWWPGGRGIFNTQLPKQFWWGGPDFEIRGPPYSHVCIHAKNPHLIVDEKRMAGTGKIAYNVAKTAKAGPNVKDFRSKAYKNVIKCW
jgi:hypothetical protein